MDKTLIILGAGASKDFCRVFPTGRELIKEINYHFLTEKKYPEVSEPEGIYLSALMNDIYKVFGNDVKLFNKIKNKLWEIQLNYEWLSLRNDVNAHVSIDNFIATKIETGELPPRASDIIKYAIYYLIKGSEQAFSEGRYDPKRKWNWIKELAEKLSTCDFNDIAENLTVVTFNYDRTFEEYFPSYLKEHISLTTEQITRLRNNVKHVYGDLGDLNEISFERKNDEVDIFKDKYKRIQLIDDRNTTEPMINADKYKKVHFIGFGYDETNMRLINIGQFTSASFHGTAYDYKDSKIKELETKYKIEAINTSCYEYVKALAL